MFHRTQLKTMWLDDSERISELIERSTTVTKQLKSYVNKVDDQMTLILSPERLNIQQKLLLASVVNLLYFQSHPFSV